MERRTTDHLWLDNVDFQRSKDNLSTTRGRPGFRPAWQVQARKKVAIKDAVPHLYHCRCPREHLPALTAQPIWLLSLAWQPQLVLGCHIARYAKSAPILHSQLWQDQRLASCFAPFTSWVSICVVEVRYNTKKRATWGWHIRHWTWSRKRE